MKAMGKTIVCCLILVVVVCMVTFVPHANAQKRLDMEILGGSFGLPNYSAMVAVADILNKFYPGMRSSVVETAGSEANIVMAEERNPNQVLFTLTDTDYWSARKKLPPWKEAHNDMRWIAGMQESLMGIVTIDPRIQTVADLKGKRFAIMPGPSAGSNGIYEQYLKLEGIWDQMSVHRMGPGEFYDALANKQLDAAALLMTNFKDGWGPIFLLQELVNSKKELVRALSLNPQILEKAIEEMSLSHKIVTVPAGALPGNKKPFVGWGILTTGLACQKDADAALIYNVAKTLVGRLPEYHKSYPANANLTPELMVALLPVENESEVHPGALKLYKEMGLWPRKK